MGTVWAVPYTSLVDVWTTPLDLRPPCSLEHVQRALDVRGDELAWVQVGVRDRDERAQVEDDLLSGDGADERLRIRQVPAIDIDLGEDVGGRVLEPPVVAARRVADECAHSSRRRVTSASTRWLPMKPPAPVTSTRRPDQSIELSPRIGGTRANLLRMRPVRLLVCVPFYAPARAFGGTVTTAIATVHGAVDAGHDVTVATTDVLDRVSRVPPGARPEPPEANVLRFPNVSQRLAATNVPLPRGLRGWLRGARGGLRLGAALRRLLGRECPRCAGGRARRRPVCAAGARHAAGDA